MISNDMENEITNEFCICPPQKNVKRRWQQNGDIDFSTSVIFPTVLCWIKGLCVCVQSERTPLSPEDTEEKKFMYYKSFKFAYIPLLLLLHFHRIIVSNNMPYYMN